MGNQPSHHYKCANEAKTVFLSKPGEVYRIPSLFYVSDRNIFLAFAEQRRTKDDASTKHLVMKTGTLTSENGKGVTTIEVIILICCVILELFSNIQFWFSLHQICSV